MPEFELLIAKNLAHLLESMAERLDSRVVAGATDFIPLVGAEKWTPSRAIDVSHVQSCAESTKRQGWPRGMRVSNLLELGHGFHIDRPKRMSQGLTP
jgi:CO/xanthine dehydrogenase FAD-binding subunit